MNIIINLDNHGCITSLHENSMFLLNSFEFEVK